MKKILILANNDVGLYKFRRELIDKLVKDNNIYICLPEGEFINDLVKMGCEFISCKLLDRHGINLIKEMRLLWFYKCILKKLKPDIVFTYTIKPNVYGGVACASLNIPYVVNITGLGIAVENKGLLHLITVNLYRYALRKAKTVFFQNIENERFFTKRKLAIGKHKMLPGSGVNLDYYKPLKYPSDETVEFVFVARIMKEKGIDQYLDAAMQIHKKYPNTKFHICGFCEQNYEKKIKELHDEGIIIYHGLVRDMREIYKSIHCIVHPTYYPEGLSNVLLESAASARPIITTNRPGCCEILEDGNNGFFVKEKDSNDLIKKIEIFMCLTWEEKREMGLYGRKKAENEFNREYVVEAYCKELMI